MQIQAKQAILNSELPKDLLCGYPYIFMVGNAQMEISNHRGIALYEKEVIEVLTKPFRLRIIGRDLSILYYAKEEIHIRGIFHSVEFLGGILE